MYTRPHTAGLGPLMEPDNPKTDTTGDVFTAKEQALVNDKMDTDEKPKAKTKPAKKTIFDRKAPKLDYGFLPRTVDIDKSQLKYEIWTPTMRFICHGKNIEDARRLAKRFDGEARRDNTYRECTPIKTLNRAAESTKYTVTSLEKLLKTFQGMKGDVAGIIGLGKGLKVTIKELEKTIQVLKSADFKITVPILGN
jgi:hypothetical protein